MVAGPTRGFRELVVWPIAANIAECYTRRGRADKVRFLNTSQASLEEVRYYLILAEDLGYGDTAQAMAAIEEVSKILSGHIAGILGHDS